MSGTLSETISQLPAAANANTSDLVPVTQGSSGPGTGQSRSVTVAQLLALIPASRTQGRMLIQWVSGAIVTNTQVWFVVSAPYGGTITSLDYLTGNGSFTVEVFINGTPVTGLTAVAISSATLGNTAASGANTFAAGATITATITSATGSPTQALLELNATWN